MAEEQDEESSVWFKFPFGSGGARGRHISHLVYVTALFFVVLFYMWVHDQNTKERSSTTQAAIARSNEKLYNLVEQSNKNQILLTCVISHPEIERKSEFEEPNSACNRMAR